MTLPFLTSRQFCDAESSAILMFVRYSRQRRTALPMLAGMQVFPLAGMQVFPLKVQTNHTYNLLCPGHTQLLHLLQLSFFP